MNGYLWAATGAVIGLMLPVLFFRWRRSSPGETADRSAELAERPPSPAPASVAAKRKPPGGFHGVTLKPCVDACAAVQAIAGQRFLSREAPALPLNGCDQERCDCTYGHYSDRRDQGDRRSGWDRLGGFAQTFVEGERRSKEGNRRTRS